MPEQHTKPKKPSMIQQSIIDARNAWRKIRLQAMKLQTALHTKFRTLPCHHNENPTPFIWTAKANDISAESRSCQHPLKF